MSALIAADIGGTNLRLGLFHHDGNGLVLERSIWIPTTDVPHTLAFIEALEKALEASLEKVDCLVVAIAGPVMETTRAKLTNGCLELDFQACPIKPRVAIINDFMAQAYAVISPVGLSAELLHGPSAAAPGNRAILGAGTGLGQAALLQTNNKEDIWAIMPSENGHTAFPFTSTEEYGFNSFLCQHMKLPYATAEDVLSGRGLAALHLFLTSEELEAAEVGARALGSDTPTLAWYSRFYARACRHWILATMCSGGLWIAGGIAARNPFCVNNSHFAMELVNSPRWDEFLESVPVYLMSDCDSGLWGAALCGLELLKEQA